MAQLQALLQIKADVQGEGKVESLGRALGGLNTTAGKVSGGLKAMLSSASGLSGALGALGGAVTGAGLAAMAQGAINAADDMNDLSQKTGVSVERLSQFQQAAEMSGTNIEAVGAGLVRLSKAMVASLDDTANAATSSMKATRQRTKEEIDKAADDVKVGADRQVDAVKEGERKQIDAIKAAADKRVQAIQNETDKRLSELNRRYRQEEKLLNDRYEDEGDRQEQLAEESQRIEERRIEDYYEIKREQIQNDERISKEQKSALLRSLQDQQEDQLVALRNGYESQSKLRSRALRDAEEQESQALETRKAKEEAAIKASAERQAEAIRKSAEAQASKIEKQSNNTIETIKAAAAAAVAALNPADDEIESLEEGLGKSGKAFKDLGISVLDAGGRMKNPGELLLELNERFSKMPAGADKAAKATQLFGRSLGAQLLPFLNMSREEIEKLPIVMSGKFAKAADEFNDKTVGIRTQLLELSISIAEALIPALTAISDMVGGLLKLFNSLPDPIKAIIGGVGGLAFALLLLAPGIAALIQVGTLLAGLKIGSTLAGYAALALPVKAAFTGLLAWMSGTFLPAMIGFFSGPVGWTVLAVAAVVAMAIAFREPIGKFFSWLGEILPQVLKTLLDLAYKIWVQPWVDIWNNVLKQPIGQFLAWLPENLDKGLKALLSLAYDIWVKPWVDIWDNVLRKPISDLLSWMGNAIRAPFEAAANFVKGIFNGILRTIGNGIKFAADRINVLIRGYNSLPLAPDLPLIPPIEIPQFAEGGVVNRPTLAMVGEGGEREYIIPESKMAAASARYLSGGRGDAVLSGGAGNAIINIRTGPVMSAQGQQWVTMADLERAVRQTEAGVMARIRTPAGRRALGIR